MRPRLLARMDGFLGFAGDTGSFPRLLGVVGELGSLLQSAWPEARIPEYAALAGPRSLRANVGSWWRPGL
jgi:hypothetical protein